MESVLRVKDLGGTERSSGGYCRGPGERCYALITWRGDSGGQTQRDQLGEGFGALPKDYL